MTASPLATTPAALVLTQPDDWHVHLRDGEPLADIVAHTARQFARAIVMPNLAPPVTTADLADAYRTRIRAVVPENVTFEPLMTTYLTDASSPDDIAAGFARGSVTACKLYPAHATTNSAQGVTEIKEIWPVLERMQKIGMPLLIHGEVTDHTVDIFDREAVFIDRVLRHVVQSFPALKIVFEHITTAEAVAFVEASPANIAATITPHHLHINRNAMFEGGIRPHFYCLPVAKRERHRLALRKAATSASPKFFLGTDSAPHDVTAKETACGCAGIFNAPFALESYAAVFEEEGALGRLEAFAALHGPAFYGLKPNTRQVRLIRQDVEVPALCRLGPNKVVPFHATTRLHWRFAGIVQESPT
jgi:dihydroorotase